MTLAARRAWQALVRATGGRSAAHCDGGAPLWRRVLRGAVLWGCGSPRIDVAAHPELRAALEDSHARLRSGETLSPIVEAATRAGASLGASLRSGERNEPGRVALLVTGLEARELLVEPPPDPGSAFRRAASARLKRYWPPSRSLGAQPPL